MFSFIILFLFSCFQTVSPSQAEPQGQVTIDYSEVEINGENPYQ